MIEYGAAARAPEQSVGARVHQRAGTAGARERAPRHVARRSRRAQPRSTWPITISAISANSSPPRASSVSALNLAIAPGSARQCRAARHRQSADPGLDAAEIEKLERYVERGGNLLWLIDQEPLHGLEPIAERLGLILTPGVVVDPGCRSNAAAARSWRSRRPAPTARIRSCARFA